MATLQEIRAKLQAAEDKKSGNNQSKSNDHALYPFWNMADGDTISLRFLPDADTSNSYFWVERAMIKLPFAGIKGQENSKPCTIQVPCMEMWNEVCPILAEVRPWFKDKNLEELGKKYWKKRNYLFQGFVRKDTLNEEDKPENPIRKFIVSPQVYNLVKAALMDPELEELPVDYERGLDFHVTKGSKGGYADYSTSKWSRKESALTEEERSAIETHGLFDIKDWLPKKPTEVELKVMVEMFEASVDGQAYDLDKWGQYFKPYGVSLKDADGTEPTTSKGETEPARAPTVETKAAPVTQPATTGSTGGSKAEDILAMIRNRQKTPS